jgi:hypothetical protein
VAEFLELDHRRRSIASVGRGRMIDGFRSCHVGRPCGKPKTIVLRRGGPGERALQGVSARGDSSFSSRPQPFPHLSSRPERSEAEGSAVLVSSPKLRLLGWLSAAPRALNIYCHPERGRCGDRVEGPL